MNPNLKLVGLNELLSDDSSPPKPVIDNGVLLDGTLLLLIGPPKSKKTFLTMNLALSIASGSDFSGFKIPKPKKVLYLLAEGGFYPTRDRLKKMAKGKNQNLFVGFPHYLPINTEDGYHSLYNLVKEVNPDVLILDPLIKFHDVDENSASQMSDVLGKIRTMMAELKLSVIIVHHTGKVASRGGRGSSVIVGDYDSCIEICKSDNGNVSLKFDMRHVETPPIKKIRFNPDTFWFENESGIVELIESAGGDILKKDFLKSYGKPIKTAYRHIDNAVKSGLIEKDGKHLVLVEWENSQFSPP